MRFVSGPRHLSVLALAIVAVLLSEDGAVGQQRARQDAPPAGPTLDRSVRDNVERLLAEGMQTFRYDTFGSEEFWGGQVKLHQAIEGEKFGGVGPGVSPKQALELGLKVDMGAVPKNVTTAIKADKVDLNDPANTLLLLKANAIVGVTGFFNQDGKSLKSIGIQCALCHSTVDNAFLPGIGRRLDGWPNRDLDIGAIVASAPDLSAFGKLLQVDEATVRKVLTSWGRGKFDAQLNLDGKAFRPDGKPAATLNPPAFGLAGVNNHTWTGAWGTVTYWNAYVGNLEMHGKGRFYDPRLDNAEKYPIAARSKQGHKADAEDRITAKLPALHFYQLSLPTPKAPPSAFDARAAAVGEKLFAGKAPASWKGCPVSSTWKSASSRDRITDVQNRRRGIAAGLAGATAGRMNF